MPHDPELVAETRGWFVRASTDLASARVDLTVEPPLTGDAVFHAQQAAEVAMEGFLTWHSRVFRKTHNLTELGERCAGLDPRLPDEIRPS
jgi:HEPN domain-containing protein